MLEAACHVCRSTTQTGPLGWGKRRGGSGFPHAFGQEDTCRCVPCILLFVLVGASERAENHGDSQTVVVLAQGPGMPAALRTAGGGAGIIHLHEQLRKETLFIIATGRSSAVGETEWGLRGFLDLRV